MKESSISQELKRIDAKKYIAQEFNVPKSTSKIDPAASEEIIILQARAVIYACENRKRETFMNNFNGGEIQWQASNNVSG